MSQILLFLFAAQMAGAEPVQCPPPRGQTEIAHASIMIQFGRSLMPVSQLGFRGALDIKDDFIKKAILGVEVATECARLLSTADCSEAVLPAKVRGMSPEENRKYRERYAQHIQAFMAILAELKVELERQLELAPVERDFSAALQMEKRLSEIANTAHAEL